MVKKDYYTAKEIIMGTRSEYQRIQSNINMLESMICSDDKQVKDFYITLFKESHFNNPTLYCTFVQNEKTLRGHIWSLEKKLGTFIYGRNNIKIKKDDSGKYLVGNDKYKAYIKTGMDYEFDLLVHQILNDEFVKKIDSDELGILGIPNVFNMYIALSSIGIYTDTYSNNNNLIYFDYLVDKDAIHAVSRDKYFDDEMINNVLGFKVPKESLSEFHRQIIDNNLSTSKPIEISSATEYVDNKNFWLDIKETDDKIVLLKTNRKKR